MKVGKITFSPYETAEEIQARTLRKLMSDVRPPARPETCQRCNLQPATQNWCDSGTLGMVHGFLERWCEGCVVAVQLEAAKASAARIPALEARLLELTKAVDAVRKDPR